MEFIVYDIAPEKATDFGAFIDEMNGVIQLITVANAPYISEADLDSKLTVTSLKKEENGYLALFEGIKEDGNQLKAEFYLTENSTMIFSAKFSRNDGNAMNLWVTLNCDNEQLVREEIVRAFERKVSQEGLDFIANGPEEETENIQEPMQDAAVSESVTEHENSQPELIEALPELPDELVYQLKSDAYLLAIFSAMAHDITRAGIAPMQTNELKDAVLENGAKIKLLDSQNERYKLTFRKGSLANLLEVSFYLETIQNQLILEVYLSSAGKGRLVSGFGNREANIQQAKSILAI
jgi:hypothetical protein